ncbi:hypothetical protein DL93DRAFT_2172103 [Clavulina sp. PMI_390]|nr:hypothetical protein DL93DRAFT_2172103 [Clavulina sp. PMI_390]
MDELTTLGEWLYKTPLTDLPAELFVLIVEKLDIRSIVRLCVVSHSMQDRIKSHTVAMALVVRFLSEARIPAASFSLSKMGPSDLFKLITRRERFLWMTGHAPSAGPLQGRRTDINLVIPESAEAFPPPGHITYEGGHCEYPNGTPLLLPGGRWIVVLSGLDRNWHFSCYDLQTLVPDDFYQPVTTLALNPDIQGYSIWIHQHSSCAEDSTFNFLLSSARPGVTSIPWQREWYCFIRLHTDPFINIATLSNIPLPAIFYTHDWNLTLAGHFISFESPPVLSHTALSEALVWNAREDIISNVTPLRPATNDAPQIQTARFIPTCDGDLLELFVSADDSKSTMMLTFTMWTLTSNNMPGNITLQSMQSHSIPVEIGMAAIGQEVTHVSINGWSETINEVFIKLRIRRGWQQLLLYLTLNKESKIPRILHSEGLQNSDLDNLSAQPQSVRGPALPPKTPLPYDPGVAISAGFVSTTWRPYISAEIIEPTGLPNHIRLPNLLAETNPQALLRISPKFGPHNGWMVFEARHDDGSFECGSNDYTFCQWSGRWLLPSMRLIAQEKPQYGYEDDILGDNSNSKAKPVTSPVQKQFRPYMVVDPVE